jgi:hypothetical protein
MIAEFPLVLGLEQLPFTHHDVASFTKGRCTWTRQKYFQFPINFPVI